MKEQRIYVVLVHVTADINTQTCINVIEQVNETPLSPPLGWCDYVKKGRTGEKCVSLCSFFYVHVLYNTV